MTDLHNGVPGRRSTDSCLCFPEAIPVLIRPMAHTLSSLRIKS